MQGETQDDEQTDRQRAKANTHLSIHGGKQGMANMRETRLNLINMTKQGGRKTEYSDTRHGPLK